MGEAPKNDIQSLEKDREREWMSTTNDSSREDTHTSSTNHSILLEEQSENMGEVGQQHIGLGLKC